MSSFTKLPRKIFFFSNYLLRSKQNLRFTSRPFTSYCKIMLCNNLIKMNIRNSDPFKTLVSREKTTSKKKPCKKDDDDDGDDDDDEFESDEEDDHNIKGDEVKIYETQAARVDKLLKICFRISRKDVEDLFYQTKVRVNGKILKKKSANANIGDEIDIINGFVNFSSKLININRIEILNIKKDFENLRYSVKVKKSKSLIIENYSASDEWRG